MNDYAYPCFGPIREDEHINQKCAACQEPFALGQFITLVPIGPGADEEARERKRAGRPYNAVAALAHYACVTGFEPPAAS